MKRGEIWSVAGGSQYSGKPRPAVIVQDDHFPDTESVALCAFTTDPTEAPLIRLAVEPSDTNNLRNRCRLMVDKVTTVHRRRLGYKIGTLDDEDIARLNRSMMVLLGLAGR